MCIQKTNCLCSKREAKRATASEAQHSTSMPPNTVKGVATASLPTHMSPQMQNKQLEETSEVPLFTDGVSAYRAHFSCRYTGKVKARSKRKITWYVHEDVPFFLVCIHVVRLRRCRHERHPQRAVIVEHPRGTPPKTTKKEAGTPFRQLFCS